MPSQDILPGRGLSYPHGSGMGRAAERGTVAAGGGRRKRNHRQSAEETPIGDHRGCLVPRAAARSGAGRRFDRPDAPAGRPGCGDRFPSDPAEAAGRIRRPNRPVRSPADRPEPLEPAARPAPPAGRATGSGRPAESPRPAVVDGPRCSGSPRRRPRHADSRPKNRYDTTGRAGTGSPTSNPYTALGESGDRSSRPATARLRSAPRSPKTIAPSECQIWSGGESVITMRSRHTRLERNLRGSHTRQTSYQVPIRCCFYVILLHA